MAVKNSSYRYQMLVDLLLYTTNTESPDANQMDCTRLMQSYTLVLTFQGECVVTGTGSVSPLVLRHTLDIMVAQQKLLCK